MKRGGFIGLLQRRIEPEIALRYALGSARLQATKLQVVSGFGSFPLLLLVGVPSEVRLGNVERLGDVDVELRASGNASKEPIAGNAVEHPLGVLLEHAAHAGESGVFRGRLQLVAKQRLAGVLQPLRRNEAAKSLISAALSVLMMSPRKPALPSVMP